MAEYQITYWRDIPSLVVARNGDEVVKVQLSARFQEQIDQVAMDLGLTGSDAYLEGWHREAWTPAEGAPGEIAARIARSLEEARP
jgi:hypothetical protein